MSEVCNAYNNAKHKIDEEDLIAVVLNAAPHQYHSILTGERRQHKNDDDLTCDDLAKVMQEHYRPMNPSASNEDDDENEIGLVGAVAGICYNYRKKGHKSHQRPDKKKGKSKNSIGIAITVTNGVTGQ